MDDLFLSMVGAYALVPVERTSEHSLANQRCAGRPTPNRALPRRSRPFDYPTLASDNTRVFLCQKSSAGGRPPFDSRASSPHHSHSFQHSSRKQYPAPNTASLHAQSTFPIHRVPSNPRRHLLPAIASYHTTRAGPTDCLGPFRHLPLNASITTTTVTLTTRTRCVAPRLCEHRRQQPATIRTSSLSRFIPCRTWPASFGERYLRQPHTIPYSFCTSRHPLLP